jgi:hypothetical protein
MCKRRTNLATHPITFDTELRKVRMDDDNMRDYSIGRIHHHRILVRTLTSCSAD